MSTSEPAQRRHVRRPTQKPSEDVRAPHNPPDSITDGDLPAHSPLPLPDADERYDSVLLSSRSTTTSLSRQQTLSHTARTCAFTESPFLYSPTLAAARYSNTPTVTLKSTANSTPTSAKVSPTTATATCEGENVESNEGVVANKKPDGPFVAGATPEKSSAKRGLQGSPSPQTHIGGDVRNDGSELHPVEESLSFEIYNCHPYNISQGRNPFIPNEMRFPRSYTGSAYRESPVAPNVLPMVSLPDDVNQRYLASASSREQPPGGRYAAMSQSSRSEEAHQLTPRPTDGESFFVEGSSHPNGRGTLLDDNVRHSATESFLADDGGSSSAQPLRVDASMSSQSFMRNFKRRHTAKAASGRGGNAGNGRYASASSSGSHRISADVAATSGSSGAGPGPEVFSSDQLTQLRPAHSKRRGGNAAATAAAAAAPDDGGDTPHGRQDVNVLGINSSDMFTRATTAPAEDGVASPSTADFSMVRAPVTGLHAKVLGNTAVDENEAAEDPEERELLTQQIHNFVSKIVRKHREESTGSPQAQPPSSPSGLPALDVEHERKAEILRRANAEAAAEEAELQKKERRPGVNANAAAPHSLSRPLDASPTTPPGDTTAANSNSNEPTAAEGGRPGRGEKAHKRVRFNLEGLPPRDEEGPNALQMPRHSMGRTDGAPVKRPLSPPVLLPTPDTPTTASSATPAGETKHTSTRRHSSPQTVDVRSLLCAGVTERNLQLPSSPTAEGTATTTTDAAEAEETTSPLPLRYPVSVADSFMSSQPCTRKASRDDNDEQQPQRTTVTSDVSFTPTSALPSSSSAVNTVGGAAAATTKCLPVPPAPAAAMQFTSPTQEPQRRHKSAAKVRKASKMHRKAVVALVVGASESVTALQSRDSSSTQHSQLGPLTQPSLSLLSSMEVCMPASARNVVCVNLSKPNIHAPPPINTSVNSTSTSPMATSTGPPHGVAPDIDAATPSKRAHRSEWGPQNRNTNLAAAAPSTLTAFEQPPPLRSMQLTSPQQTSAVLVSAATAATTTSSLCSKDGEAKRPREPARRRSAAARTAPTDDAGSSTAPSSRRSSLAVNGPTAPKPGAFAELPPLSASLHSRTSTPDVAGSPTTATATNIATTTGGEAQGVLLPAALNRRPSALHDAAGLVSWGRQEHSCSTAEFKDDREMSPRSANGSERSATRESSVAGSASEKALAMQQLPHVLPRLSGSSLKPRSASQTITPPFL
ncbi:hypothetical protein ABB37_02399 [Leptomonas pyrrhocoris]|uniref:Uncharacterized protein n=1 Tax=Leptomonas pyrrhocoris TaxID=157538 RepID=A0A0M9G7Y3_LEPPY|nr:hypothetical protein ABB37_02399 [Leptomonas pyrrhocoris]KPA84423.1 hypothetical protein ABB37_02399 [Leptomonas pyrrhocoris]|eukprot:XP_015662862.1 hypothetical protein ABB37_02399 [Leptomonas pyrrhocoris]